MSLRDDELDRAIDDVAREMMSAETSPGLRARVLAGLDDGHRQRTAGLPRWAWTGALAAAAVIVVGVWLTRPWIQPQPAGSPVQVAVSKTPVAPTLESPVPPTRLVEPGRLEAVTVRRRAASRPAPPAPGLAWEAGPAPLPVPDAITIDTLEPSALAVPGIDVAPLGDIQPITIPAAAERLPEPQRRETR